MLSIGRARHPGPVRGKGVPMDSCAQFLAIAEHRLILAKVRFVGHQLRKADCQDHISYIHAKIGVVSLCGAPLAAPSLVTSEFKECFRLR